jgi:peptide/nickel transport system substrate-binding protein
MRHGPSGRLSSPVRHTGADARHNEGVHMFQRRRKLRLAGVAATAAVAMLAAGCGSSTSSSTPATGAKITGGTATVSNISGAGANWIFPFASSAYYSVTNYEDFMYLIDRPLYMFGGNNNSITVNYALSPANAPIYSNGGKTVTITLKGWNWSNGEKVDAQDVIFWLNMDEGEKASFAGYSAGGIPDDLVSYKATGPDTVVLQLNKAYSSIWYTYNELAQITPFPAAWDISKTGAASGSGGCATDTAADKWAKCKAVLTYLTAQAKDTSSYASPTSIWAVENGPWKLSTYNTNGNYTFVPNPKYSGSPKPTLSALKFVSYTSDTAIYTGLKTGSLSVGPIPAADLAVKPASQVLPSVNPLGSSYYLQPAYPFGISYSYINFNNPVTGPIFKQLYFRQALQQLTDQTGITATINRGYGYPTTSGVPNQPPSQWVSSAMTENNAAGPFPFSESKAEATLAAHGWSKVSGVLTCEKAGSAANECGAGITKGQQAKFSMNYTSGISSQASTVAVLKSDYASAGIQLTANAETFNTLLGETIPCHGSSCTWDFLFLGGWDFNGPGFEPTGEPLYQTGAANNSGGYSNPQMDSLINATHTSNSISVFHTYANYTAAQVPVLFLPETYAVEAVSSKLHNVTQNPLATFFPQYWYFTK